jgi:twitching motility two-component system response regulator PilH
MTTILIIDDSTFQRRILRGMLAERGCTVLEAQTGMEGLRLVEEKRPDIILLDILLPDISGIDVLIDLEANYHKIPVVMCSADIQEATHEECMKHGARAFLGKPVKKEELNRCLDAALVKG